MGMPQKQVSTQKLLHQKTKKHKRMSFSEATFKNTPGE